MKTDLNLNEFLSSKEAELEALKVGDISKRLKIKNLNRDEAGMILVSSEEALRSSLYGQKLCETMIDLFVDEKTSEILFPQEEHSDPTLSHIQKLLLSILQNLPDLHNLISDSIKTHYSTKSMLSMSKTEMFSEATTIQNTDDLRDILKIQKFDVELGLPKEHEKPERFYDLSVMFLSMLDIKEENLTPHQAKFVLSFAHLLKNFSDGCDQKDTFKGRMKKALVKKLLK